MCVWNLPAVYMIIFLILIDSTGALVHLHKEARSVSLSESFYLTCDLSDCQSLPVCLTLNPSVLHCATFNTLFVLAPLSLFHSAPLTPNLAVSLSISLTVSLSQSRSISVHLSHSLFVSFTIHLSPSHSQSLCQMFSDCCALTPFSDSFLMITPTVSLSVCLMFSLCHTSGLTSNPSLSHSYTPFVSLSVSFSSPLS